MPFTREQLIADTNALLNEGVKILKAEVEPPPPRKAAKKGARRSGRLHLLLSRDQQTDFLSLLRTSLGIRGRCHLCV